MEDNASKKVRRSKEEIVSDKIAAKQAKIAEYREKIAALEKEIDELQNPPLTMRDIQNMISDNKIPLEDAMKALKQLTNR